MTPPRSFLIPVSALLGVLLVAWKAPYLCAHRGTVPSLGEVRARWVPSDAVVLDRQGNVLNELRVDEQRRRLQWTPLAEVSPALGAALIASEDRRFASHRGVDGLALLGIVGRALLGEPARGASTITMQVAAMLEPRLRRDGRPRTPAQKWRQMRWAWALERAWVKTEILEAYLNLVTFRGELQGIAAAARIMLGKAPSGVTDGEALVLAALVRAPNAQRDTVARRARRLRTATAVAVRHDDIDAATARLLRGRMMAKPSLAPHLARRLVADDREQRSASGATHGGGSVRQLSSTIDASAQRVATHALRRQLLALAGQRVRDGAVLVVDNGSGEVLAYVGGSGELSSGRYVDAVSARRQAGSTLKPFLYALAFDARLLTPASLLDDSPLDVPVFGGLYRPENYDRHFSGVVSVRTALASSLNIPAVRVLALVGADAFVGHLRRLGFAALNEPGDFYGPALALGAADVSLEELVNAYRALANHGQLTSLRFGPPARVGDAAPASVHSAGAAFLTKSILADRDSRSGTFGLESPLATRFWTAVKTGTSKSMRDNWCVGFSERFTVGVWVGNLSGEPMRGVSGMSGAAPVWIEVMEWLHREQPSQPPMAPADVIATQVAVTGERATDRAEWFLDGTEPKERTVGMAPGRDRITQPVAGTVIAIDPDIPPRHQRVAFRADGAAGRRWRLDGVDLGVAAPVLLWAPQPGAHELTLVAADGAVVDRVTFAVRGSR